MAALSQTPSWKIREPFFSDGDVSSGSSNAAAYVARNGVRLKAAALSCSQNTLIRLARQAPSRPQRQPEIARPVSAFWENAEPQQLASVLFELR